MPRHMMLLVVALLQGPGAVWARYAPERVNETVPYEVLEDKGMYEIRRYPAVTWVSTDYYDHNIHDGFQSSLAFGRLFRYVSGDNERDVNMQRTAPLTRTVYPGKSAIDKTKAVMSFYLGEKFQKDPPKPIESKIYIEHRAEMKVAAIRFGGFASDADFLKHGRRLFTALKKDGIEAKLVPYFTVAYNSPVALENRRNEVWAILEG